MQQTILFYQFSALGSSLVYPTFTLSQPCSHSPASTIPTPGKVGSTMLTPACCHTNCLFQFSAHRLTVSSQRDNIQIHSSPSPVWIVPMLFYLFQTSLIREASAKLHDEDPLSPCVSTVTQFTLHRPCPYLPSSK